MWFKLEEHQCHQILTAVIMMHIVDIKWYLIKYLLFVSGRSNPIKHLLHEYLGDKDLLHYLFQEGVTILNIYCMNVWETKIYYNK